MWQVWQRACPASGHLGGPTTRWPRFGSSRAGVHRSGSPSGVGQGRVGLNSPLKPNDLERILPYGQLIRPEIARTRSEFETKEGLA